MKEVKYLVVPLLVCLIMVTGCGKKKEENNQNNNTTTTTSVKQEISINVEERDNRLYVNGNMVDFYSNSEFGEFYNDENEFYSTCVDGNFISNYKTGDGFVFVQVAPCDRIGIENFLINKDGKIVKKINGKNADITLSVDNQFLSVESVENNSIYFRVGKYTQDPNGFTCSKIIKNEGQEIFIYIDKMTYLGDDEFELDKGVKTISYEEYANQNHIECDQYDNDFVSEKTINPSEECSICVVSRYVSNITLNKYGNVYMNKNNGESEKIGENVIDVELFSYGNGGCQAIIMLQKNGTITAVNANDSEDIKILRNFANLNNIVKIDKYKAIDNNGTEHILTLFVLDEFKVNSEQ